MSSTTPPAGDPLQYHGVPMPPPPQEHPPKYNPPPMGGTSGMAIAAFCISLFGGVLISVILAIIALTRIRDRGQTGKGLAIAALVISGCWSLVLAAGITWVALTSAERDTAGRVTDAGDLEAFEIAVGDCFNQPDGAMVLSVAAVPCTEPHELEAYATFDLIGSDFPGNTEVGREADERCTARFEEFVGMAYADSVLELYILHPTEESWTSLDDRTVLCAITDPTGGPVTTTLKGASR